MLADPTLGRWRSLDLAEARRFAGEAAARVDGRVLPVETVEHLGAPLHRVRIERGGRDSALVPGGRVRLGFDPGARSPTPAQEADFAEGLAEGYGFGAPDLLAHLVAEPSPPRTVEVPTVWMAVEAEPTPEPPDGAVHGGDGGTAVCGGYGSLLGRLPPATAHRDADTAEFAYGPDREYARDSFPVRPVLTLP
ncbi:hypothetical protein ACFXPI_20370 [Streptomyces sp. NPDC059104]|uniref:hypothetical protein n=1 Tax=Streptomyces sp. NPDC059104 TaxID=3346729 RepID=UPI0036953DED